MPRRAGLGSHQSTASLSCEWATPPHVLAALGGAQAFALDPCAMINGPWPCARNAYTLREDGLAHRWPKHWNVFMNPPYGAALTPWLARLAEHGNGIALVFNRSERDDFHRYVWPAATAMLVLRGRLHFHRPDGARAKFNGGAPSILVAYGADQAERLLRCGLPGFFVELKHGRMIG